MDTDPVVTQRELTHEFSKIDPEGFKELLVESLGRNTRWGSRVWALATQRGLASAQDLTLDPSNVASREGEGPAIILGTAPDTAKNGRLFEPDSFSYQREVAYRLVHEVLHKFKPHQQGPFNDLYKFLYGKRMRMQSSGLGVTPLGNLFRQSSLLNKR